MLKVIYTLFIFGFVSVSHAGVIIIGEYINGHFISLLGADNVEVNGSFYNVRFLDGTCIALFNGCDASKDFLFGTMEDAQAASGSLLAQVYSAGSLLGKEPEYTDGCSDKYGCEIFTAYGVNAGGAVAATVTEINFLDDNDAYDYEYWELNDDTVPEAWQVYAVWSEPVEASEPGTAMVLLMGIAGLIVSQRRKQA